MTLPAVRPLVASPQRAAQAAALATLVALVPLGGCAPGRTPLRPAPGSDLARPEGAIDRVVRGVLTRCDTARGGPTVGGGTARDADPCRRPAADTAGRVQPDTLVRAPKVP